MQNDGMRACKPGSDRGTPRSFQSHPEHIRLDLSPAQNPGISASHRFFAGILKM